ncbi:gamma-glutamyltransferase [Microvirga makkahensis]|uniref:Gamma-glutamyltransferase n=1 Tax=Microvirga makkahensis TaxID=1128670 RepID=A0A7X3MRY3_9HYPH|nr:gamma-glutamyltransferase [Microvirga makkahensis]MXQ12132.1 gamma-glutamyltransferase [Microvirga makkahensis]
MNALSRTQVVLKPAVASKGGVVAAQNRLAAAVGAEILENGGDAVDAAVATSFALGVLEPWMSGPAGGGAMVIWRAEEAKAYSVFYGMRSPAGIDPADYPLSASGTASDLFPWKSVVGDRNVEGATSIAVPGTINGIGTAHKHFGRMSWRELLQPAAIHARRGFQIDWYAALIIASATRSLAKDPDAAALFLEDGQWPPVPPWTALDDRRVQNARMADTICYLAEEGFREFYEGEIAKHLAADVQAKGGSLSFDDLRTYHAEMRQAALVPYRDGGFYVAPDLTAGPTFADVFHHLTRSIASPCAEPESQAYCAYADAIDSAYRARLAEAGDREAPHRPACTTHFSVVDRHGNMVAKTQTLLSVFGSRVVSPSTGLLLNNGIMWFDPEPGHPNSLAPAKRCLMNVCPVIGETGEARFAIGASGGRKILPAVAQLSSFLIDYRMSLEEAFHQPRIDVSGGPAVIGDEMLAPKIIEALSERRRVVTTKRTVYPNAFACPTGVMRKGGINYGASEIMSPWADAVAESFPRGVA